jgi:hypothetical protein
MFLLAYIGIQTVSCKEDHENINEDGATEYVGEYNRNSLQLESAEMSHICSTCGKIYFITYRTHMWFVS